MFYFMFFYKQELYCIPYFWKVTHIHIKRISKRFLKNFTWALHDVLWLAAYDSNPRYATPPRTIALDVKNAKPPPWEQNAGRGNCQRAEPVVNVQYVLGTGQLPGSLRNDWLNGPESHRARRLQRWTIATGVLTDIQCYKPKTRWCWTAVWCHSMQQLEEDMGHRIASRNSMWVDFVVHVKSKWSVHGGEKTFTTYLHLEM